MFARGLAFVAASLALSALAATSAEAAGGVASPATSISTLTVGQTLAPSAELTNNGYVLVMQTDGNLVEYEGARPVWSSNTFDNPGAALLLQNDGNAVIYSTSHSPLWSTQTGGVGAGASFVLQTDGNVVLYAQGAPQWDAGAPVPPTGLANGQTLSDLHSLASPEGTYTLSLNGILTLSERYGTNGSSPTWHAGPLLSSAGSRLVMQTDGNLVLYSATDLPTWTSHTDGLGSGEHLVVQDDGNLVIYSAAGHADWSAQTGRAVLIAGMGLNSGSSLRSFIASGFLPAQLIMQTDGNLVLYAGAQVKWSSGTSVPGSRAVYQTDGNLVVYTPLNRAVWSSATSGQRDAQQLILLSTGSIILQNNSGTYWNVG